MPHDHKAATKRAPVTTILLVEDDADTAAFLSLAIAQETPYHALVVADGLEAVRVLQQITPNLLLIDYRLPHMNGLDLYDLLLKTAGQDVPPTIILSASVKKLEEELQARHLVGLSKPFDLTDLLQTIEQVLATRGDLPDEPGRTASEDH